jgi:NADH:ubiquinone oxidoreductase subunit E
MADKPAKTRLTIAVCVGSSCTGKKSRKVRSRLKKLVKKQNLQDKVKIKKSACMGECAKGPIIEIKPTGKRIKRVTPKRAEKLLTKIVARKLAGKKQSETK